MRSQPRPYLHPYVGGALLGLVLFASFILTGHGLGASGGLGRLIIAVQKAIDPQHINLNPYLAIAGGGAKNPLNHWVIWEILGMLFGGLVSGWIGGRLKVETRKGPRITVHQRWLFAVIGGFFMGYGARMARGCTSGQGLSGGAVLSAGSWGFLMMVFLGGYLLARPMRRLWT